MNKFISVAVFLLVICRIYAQDITISFQPKINDISIDSIRATNLRTNQIVKLLGSESLLLVKTSTGIDLFRENPEKGTIYPNPCEEDATFCLLTNKSQKVVLGLYNINGKLLNQKLQSLEPGTHHFDLKFPVTGIYYLSVLKSDGPVSFKVVYTGRKDQGSAIMYAGSEKTIIYGYDSSQFKNAAINKTLVYSEGDVIKYYIFSGSNTTIVFDSPNGSKTIIADFQNCIDDENRSYKTVKIGTQWWMAENLAFLPLVSPPSETSYTVPKYYVYGYNGMDVTVAKATANFSSYGVLYNWVASKGACPPGWHLPGDSEWKQLEMNLGMTQSQVDVTGWRGTDQDKQMKATNGWTNNMNGTNTSGFSALPVGYRSFDGAFTNVGNYGYWWSSSEVSTNNAWYRGMSYTLNGVGRLDGNKTYGFSVRCVRN